MKKDNSKKEKIKKEYSTNEPNKFKKFFMNLWELIKIIFSIGEKRITLSKGIFLYFFGMVVIYGIVRLIFIPFGVNISANNDNIGFKMAAILWLIFLWGYLSPKRAQDHGYRRYIGIIPIVNAFVFITPGDKYENDYGEKPNFWRSLKNRLPYAGKDGKDSLSAGKMLIAIGIIIVIGLCIKFNDNHNIKSGGNTNRVNVVIEDNNKEDKVEESNSESKNSTDDIDLKYENEHCKYEYSLYVNKQKEENRKYYNNYNIYCGYASNLGHCIVYQFYEDGEYPRTAYYMIEDMENNKIIFDCSYVEGEENDTCSRNLYDEKLKEIGVYDRR